jgi:hypothetical protein
MFKVQAKASKPSQYKLYTQVLASQHPMSGLDAFIGHQDTFGSVVQAEELFYLIS